MKEIKAYMSDNGHIYKQLEDAEKADIKWKEVNYFEILLSQQSFPKNYATSFHNWDCKGSPVGKCVYDYNSPMGDDDCVFCHNPDERK